MDLEIDVTGLTPRELSGLLHGASAETLIALERAGKDELGRPVCPFCANLKATGEHRDDCPLGARLVAEGVNASDDEE